MSCPACTINWNTSHSSEFVRPMGWRPLRELGLTLGTWFDANSTSPELYVCGECGMRSWLTFCERDGGSWSMVEFPARADAVVLAGSTPGDVLSAVLSHEQTLALAKRWVVEAAYTGSEFMDAVRVALPAVDTGTKARGFIQLIRWAIQDPHCGKARVTSAVIASPDILRGLFCLPSRIDCRAGVALSAVFGELKMLLEIPYLAMHLSPALRMELKGAITPVALLRVVMATLRQFIAGQCSTSALSRAEVEITGYYVSSVIVSSDDVDVLLSVFDVLKKRSPKAASHPVVSWARILNKMLETKRIAAAHSERVRIALSDP